MEQNIICKRCRITYTDVEAYKKHMRDHALKEKRCPHCTKKLSCDIYLDHLLVCKKVPQCLAPKERAPENGLQKDLSELDSCNIELPHMTQENVGTSKISKNANTGERIPVPLSAHSVQNHEDPKQLPFSDKCGTSVASQNNSFYSDEKLKQHCVVNLSRNVFASGEVSDATTTNSNNVANKSSSRAAVGKRQNVLNIQECICGSVSSSQTEFELHVAEKHNSVHCSECNTTFRNALSHALHSCFETSTAETGIGGQGCRLDPLSLTGDSNIESTSSHPLDEGNISRLPTGKRFSPCDENYDMEPAVPSNSLTPAVLKARKTNGKETVGDSRIKSCSSSSSSRHVGSTIVRTLSKNIPVRNNVSTSENNASTSTIPNLMHNSTSSIVPDVCKRSSLLNTQKSRVPFTNTMQHSTQAKIHGHSQTQYLQQKESTPYGQWPQFSTSQTGRVAHCSCCQCVSSDVVSLNSNLLGSGFHRRENEAFSHAKNMTYQQMQNGKYYAPHSNVPVYLIPALSIQTSGSKIHDHSASSLSLVSSQKLGENSLGPPSFYQVSSMGSSSDPKNKICRIANVTSMRNSLMSEVPVKKHVNVTFPNVRSLCHASAVMSAAAADDNQTFKHYSCEQCNMSFFSAEAVIVHLENDHRINVGNELKVFVL